MGIGKDENLGMFHATQAAWFSNTWIGGIKINNKDKHLTGLAWFQRLTISFVNNGKLQ